jgi:hypothetical protein
MTSGKIGATLVDAIHRGIEVRLLSAGCVFLRTGWFCAAQLKQRHTATSVQRRFRSGTDRLQIVRANLFVI